MATILIVEDDTALRTGLEFDFTTEGYQVISAENGTKALEHIEGIIELAILDVNLPDTDGFTLCRKIKSHKNIPVIFLTARDLEEDEMQGFECGADDYVTKPFSMPLLRKRAEAVLKRYSQNNAVYSDGYITVNFESFTATRENEVILFTPTEYKLLKVFMVNSGRVITRQVLLEKLWDNENNFVDEHALTVNINRLRGKLENGNHKYIKTVYGMGYIWVGDRL